MSKHTLISKSRLLGALSAVAVLAWGPPASAAVKVISKDCLACHAPVQKEYARKQIHPPFKDQRGCEACHKRHGVVGVLVLKAEEPGLCFGCHKKEEPEFKQAHLHTPLALDKDGKAGKCTTCHSPHSSDNGALLKAAGNEVCFTCHTRERFTRATIHPPASANCLGCHKPHAGPETALLQRSESELCGSCHHPGGSAKPASHSGFSVEGVGCTSCHTPHASVDKGLLREVVHPPTSDCATCHRPASSGQKPGE